MDRPWWANPSTRVSDLFDLSGRRGGLSPLQQYAVDERIKNITRSYGLRVDNLGNGAYGLGHRHDTNNTAGDALLVYAFGDGGAVQVRVKDMEPFVLATVDQFLFLLRELLPAGLDLAAIVNLPDKIRQLLEIEDECAAASPESSIFHVALAGDHFEAQRRHIPFEIRGHFFAVLDNGQVVDTHNMRHGPLSREELSAVIHASAEEQLISRLQLQAPALPQRHNAYHDRIFDEGADLYN